MVLVNSQGIDKKTEIEFINVQILQSHTNLLSIVNVQGLLKNEKFN